MDFSTIRSRVSLYLDRDDSSITTYINNWINDTRADLALMPEVNWAHLWTETTYTTSAGSSDYALPSDYLDHLLIRVGNKVLGGLQQRDWERQMFDDRDDSETNAEPENYVIEGTTIVLHPPPDAAYTLRLFYYAAPSDLSSDTDTDYWTNRLPLLLIYGAVVMGAAHFEDMEKLQIYSALYNKQLAKAVKKEKAKKVSDVVSVLRTHKDFNITHFKEKFRPRA